MNASHPDEIGPDTLERHLRSGGAAPSAEASPRFTAQVMAAVRREACRPPPLPFPWKRLALGALLALAWFVLGYRAVRGLPAERVLDMAQRGGGLLAAALLLALVCWRFARFCVRTWAS